MFKVIVSTILMIGALLFLTNIALSDESATCSFAGTVKLDGVDVVDGTVITANIEGVEYRTTTPTGYGASTYAITIQPANYTYYQDDTLVTFKVGDCEAEQTVTWQAGKTIRLDLTALTPPPTSAATTSIWLIVGIAIAFVIEFILVSGTAYIVIRQWNRST